MHATIRTLTLAAIACAGCGKAPAPPESAIAIPPPKPPALEWLRVSDDKTHFVGSTSGKRFVVWGFNYDRDDDGRLLEDYWEKEWGTVVEDFQEMKALGANVVRVHLQ